MYIKINQLFYLETCNALKPPRTVIRGLILHSSNTAFSASVVSCVVTHIFSMSGVASIAGKWIIPAMANSHSEVPVMSVELE